MTDPHEPDEVADLLGHYAAPPPRPAFVRHVRDHLLRELERARAARRRLIRLWAWVGAAAALLIGAAWALLHDDPAPPTGSGTAPYQALGTPRRVPFTLPDPAYACTPRAVPTGPHIEPYPGPAPQPVFVPAGTRNLARGKPVTGSDPQPIIGSLRYVTDGRKRGTDQEYVELGPGLQWIQIDLEQSAVIHAVGVWHYPLTLRVYHDVVVQVSDDPAFERGVATVFNNDYDNSAGLGAGGDPEYVEDYRGRVIETGGVRGRYVRLWSRGSNDNDQNHYVEVEVYGQPPEDLDRPVPPSVELDVDRPAGPGTACGAGRGFRPK